jgi:Uma2 family endonuclease
MPDRDRGNDMATKTLISAEQYLLLDGSGPTELVRGEVISMSPPSFLHGGVCRRVAMLLGQWADATGLGEVACNDAGVITERDPDTVRGADCQYLSYARIPDGYPERGYPNVAPDLVVEVLSENDRWPDVSRKAAEYLDAGVAEVWLIDPQARIVEIRVLNEPAISLKQDDELMREVVLPGFRCRVSEFFPRR